jgi:hypothetical protein
LLDSTINEGHDRGPRPTAIFCNVVLIIKARPLTRRICNVESEQLVQMERVTRK